MTTTLLSIKHPFHINGEFQSTHLTSLFYLKAPLSKSSGAFSKLGCSSSPFTFWKDQQEIRLDLWTQVWVRALKRREWPGPEVRSACSSHPSTRGMSLNCSLRKSRFGVPGLSWESPSGLILHYILKSIADDTLRKLYLLDYYPWATKGACKVFRLLWPKLVSIWFTIVKQLPFWAFMSFNISGKKHSYIFEQLLWDTHEMKSVQSFCQLWHALWRCREINTATSAS